MENIRQIVSSVLAETQITPHFAERVMGRVVDKGNFRVGYELDTPGQYQEVGTYIIPSTMVEEIKRKVQILQSRNFNKAKSYAILLQYFPVNLSTVQFDSPASRTEAINSKKVLVLTDAETNSNGNMLYAIVRNNELTTAMLVKPYTGMGGMEGKMRVDAVIKNFDNVEQGKVR